MSSADSIKRRPKIAEIDVVRAVAILAVILIHATSEGTYIPTFGSSTQKLFFSVNMFGSFAVPVFIFISGLVLFYGYFDRWKPIDSFKFYGKRLISVVYPYLVFSLFYFLYFPLLFTGKMSLSVSSFLDQLPWGDAGYHLYYMIIIFQFYLLFPLLITLAKSARLVERGLALIGLAVQVGFYVITYGQVVQHAPSLFITYFAVFLIGASVGIHYAAVSAWARRNWLWLVALAVLVGAVYVGMFWAARYEKAHIAGYWFRIAYNAFAVSSGIALIGFGKWLIERAPRLSKPVLRLGQVSFGMYLLHPAVLSTFKELVGVPGGITGFRFYIAGGFVVTVAITWLIVEAYYKAKHAIAPPKNARKSPAVGGSA